MNENMEAIKGTFGHSVNDIQESVKHNFHNNF